MRMWKSLFISIGLSLFTLSSWAQLDDPDAVKEEAYKRYLNLEVQWESGVAIPLGAFASLSPRSGKAGNALPGVIHKLSVIHRFQRNPAWSFQLQMGYQRHKMDNAAVRTSYQLYSTQQPTGNAFVGQPWTIYSLMPTFERESKGRMTWGGSVGAGILYYSGWNALLRTQESPQNQRIQSWSFSGRTLMALRLGAKWSYALSSKLTAQLHMHYLYGQGQRNGQLIETETHQQNIVRINTFEVQAPTQIQTISLSLALRWRFYKRVLGPPMLLPR